MNNIPLTDLKSQYKFIHSKLDHAISKVINSGQFIGGEEVTKFEQEFAKYLGSKYVISVNSGTDALILGIKGLGLKKNSEIIIPTNTFYSSALAATYNGLKPVFADVDENDFGINLDDVKRKISSRTKAIMLVHLYGQADKISDVQEIIDRSGYQIYLIEDSCQTHGGIYKNKKAGTYGIFSAFSFYPTKNLGSYGDGGAIVTDNRELAKKYHLLRQYGSSKKYYHDIFGVNSRLDSLQAAILRVKLRYLDEWNTRRQRKAQLYNQLLTALYPNIITPRNFTERKSTYYVYIIRAKKRDKLSKFLKLHQITTLIHYPLPLHLQKVFLKLGYKRGSLPIAERLSNEILSLPMNENITGNQIKYIVNRIKDFYTLNS